MKRLFSAAICSCLLFACTKQAANHTQDRDEIVPVVNVIYPTTKLNLKEGDPLCMKVVFSDNKQLMAVSWEALEAAAVCGGNPHMGEYRVDVAMFDIDEQFKIPPGFEGERTIRFTAVDVQGNRTHKDITYTVSL